MVWLHVRAAAATSLLTAVWLSAFASAFVPSPSNCGPTGLAALRKASVLSVSTDRTGRTNRPQHLSTLHGEGRDVGWSQRASDGVPGGEEGGSRSAGTEERTAPTESRPAVASASGLAAGTAVVALCALGGFPELAAAAAPAWVLPAKLVLDPILLYFEVAFVARIIFSWYPKLDLNSAPQNLLAWPTEPILRPTRAIIPPAFGVDISPIVWVMICSLVHEILLGQQGILNLMSNK